MAELTLACTCVHPIECGCACHALDCDPTENICDRNYLPDDGGAAQWGCAICSPGQGAPHLASCPAFVGAGIPRQPDSVAYRAAM